MEREPIRKARHDGPREPFMDMMKYEYKRRHPDGLVEEGVQEVYRKLDELSRLDPLTGMEHRLVASLDEPTFDRLFKATFKPVK